MLLSNLNNIYYFHVFSKVALALSHVTIITTLGHRKAIRMEIIFLDVLNSLE